MTSLTLIGVRQTECSLVRASLRAKGQPVPTNDVSIAAHAMETGADLVSADSPFGHIDQIVWVSATSD